MNEVIDYVAYGMNAEEWVLVVFAGYELLVRRKKTTKDYSLLSLIGRIFKNRKKGGNRHER